MGNKNKNNDEETSSLTFNSIKVGKKYKVLPQYVEECGLCESKNMEYIIVTGIEIDYPLLHYTSYNASGERLNNCFGCYEPHHLVPYKKSSSKKPTTSVMVGTRVPLSITIAVDVVSNPKTYLESIDKELEILKDNVKNDTVRIKALQAARNQFLKL